MREIGKSIGNTNFDGLIADVSPEISVKAGTFKKGTAEVSYKRGTLFASSSKGGLVIFGTAAGDGETLTPFGVLADDVTVGKTEDETTAFYAGGAFRASKLTVKSGYSLSASDITAFANIGVKII